MYFRFSTNLDAAQPDVNRLNATSQGRFSPHEPIPRIGDTITFPFQKNGKTFYFSLQVDAVHFNYFDSKIKVVLALPKYYSNIPEWESWFKGFRYG